MEIWKRLYSSKKNNMKYIATIPNEKRNWEKGTVESTGRQDGM
jgi:hypothetical protein